MDNKDDSNLNKTYFSIKTRVASKTRYQSMALALTLAQVILFGPSKFLILFSNLGLRPCTSCIYNATITYMNSYNGIFFFSSCPEILKPGESL